MQGWRHLVFLEKPRMLVEQIRITGVDPRQRAFAVRFVDESERALLREDLVYGYPERMDADSIVRHRAEVLMPGCWLVAVRLGAGHLAGDDVGPVAGRSAA